MSWKSISKERPAISFSSSAHSYKTGCTAETCKMALFIYKPKQQNILLVVILRKWTVNRHTFNYVTVPTLKIKYTLHIKHYIFKANNHSISFISSSVSRRFHTRFWRFIPWFTDGLPVGSHCDYSCHSRHPRSHHIPSGPRLSQKVSEYIQ